MEERYYLISMMALINFASVYNTQCPSGITSDTKTGFGTKTGYETVANLASDRLEVPGCSPDFVWMFIRHGTRYPSSKRIRQMREKLPGLRDLIMEKSREGKGSVCQEGIETLGNWRFNVMDDQGMHLAPIGDRELYSLATRWKSRLGSLLNSPYHPQEFRVRYTPTQRTEASARAFLRGLFGEASINVPSVDKGDPVLRGYKTCKNWRDMVKKNPKTYEEHNKFLEGPEVTQVLEAVRKRAGLPDLERDDMILMYDMLSYEEAWAEGTGSVSPWRALFSPSDLVVLQYLDDLELFYKDGHGNNGISAQTSCKTVQDLLMSLRRSSDPEERSKAVFYFTHCGAVTKLLARMGLFYTDEPPTANNFWNRTNRVWDSSRVAPFGANLAILLYRCPRGQQPDRIQLFLHEKPLRIPDCDSDICTLDAFERYLTRPEPCDMQEICGTETMTLSKWPSASDILFAIAFIFLGKWLIFSIWARIRKMRHRHSKTD